MSTMLENASEVLFVLGILFTVAGVIFREIRRAKDPYKGRAVATVVELFRVNPTGQEKRRAFMTIIIRL